MKSLQLVIPQLIVGLKDVGMLFNQSTSKLLQSINSVISRELLRFETLIPGHLEGCSVLDLGCGTYKGAYLDCARVMTNAFVSGTDMTDKQLDVAKRHAHYHMKGKGTIYTV